MKKYIIILLTLLLVGCKKENIVTQINETENCISSITYPITKYKKLNKQIKKYIKNKNKIFKKNYCKDNDERQELNIDFKQKLINNKYLNITLLTTLNKKTEIKTYIYENNKELKIEDILTKNDIKILSGYINKDTKLNEININFDDTYLYIYENNKEITLPIEKFDLKININRDIKPNYTYTYKEITKKIDKNKKIIALTFDDGPSQYTEKIIDLLNEYNANATFFVLGNKVEIYKETLMYLLDSGNEIGNHTYNHKLLTQTDEEEIINQINKTQDIIKETLNYTPTLFRPSYGSINKTIRKNTNLDIVLWNIDSLDWKYKNSKKIYNNILPKIEDKKIILMHDTHEYTYNTLKLLLPKLLEQEYQIVTVSDLKNAK